MRDWQSRVLVLVGFISAALILMGFQLYRLTVAESALWSHEAEYQVQKELESNGPRGAILDAKGRVLATSEPVYAAVLVDQDPKHVERILPRLSQVLAGGDQQRADEIAAAVKKRVTEHVDQGRQFEDLIVATQLTPSVVSSFLEQREQFPGVRLVRQSIRVYPEGPVAGPVLGYVQPISAEDMELYKGYPTNAIVGKSGLEKFYEKELQGKKGTRSKLVDPAGRPLGIIEETQPEPGSNLRMTMDLDLQRVAEQALVERINWIKAHPDKESNPIRGALVALDAKTGAVLAMASVPTFDPNLFATGMTEAQAAELFNNPGAPLINWALTGYEPGSTYKMAVGMAAAEEGVVGLHETVLCSPTYERDPTRRNWAGWNQGRLSLNQALSQSCNPYFYEMGYRLGIDRLAAYVDQFGFGKKTGIDLPEEDSGINPTKESYGDDWQPGNVFSVGIGQGNVRVTPLQLAVYMSAIANKGVRYQPHLVSEIRSPQGEVLAKREPVVAGTVKASPETWAEVQKGMWLGANDPLGTAYQYLRGFPIKTGAKTGTAETGRAWSNAATVIYAPYDDPQIVVAAVVEGGAHGSWIVPAVRAVLAQYFGIQDDESMKQINHKAD